MSPSARVSGTCDPIEGISCPAGTQCIAGLCLEPPAKCRDNDQCPVGYLCRSGTCVWDGSGGKPSCSANIHCAAGQVCVNGVCKTTQACKIAGIDRRLQGSWRLDSTLHVRDGLKGFAKGLLSFASTLQKIILGKFSIKGLPSFATALITAPLQRLISQYVPPWAQHVIELLANIDDAIDDMRIISTEHLRSLGGARYVGSSTWTQVKFEYKGTKISANPAAVPALGKVTTTSYAAREICGTLYMDKHKVNNQIGKIYRWAVEALITGISCATKGVPCYKGIRPMFNDLIKCQQLGPAVAQGLGIPGVAVAVTAACNAQKAALITQLIDALDKLALELNFMTLRSKATISNNNLLTQGRWYGVLGGSYGNGNFEGKFSGTRLP